MNNIFFFVTASRICRQISSISFWNTLYHGLRGIKPSLDFLKKTPWKRSVRLATQQSRSCTSIVSPFTSSRTNRNPLSRRKMFQNGDPDRPPIERIDSKHVPKDIVETSPQRALSSQSHRYLGALCPFLVTETIDTRKAGRRSQSKSRIPSLSFLLRRKVLGIQKEKEKKKKKWRK